MRKLGLLSVVVFFMTLCLVTESFAQGELRQRGSGGWGPGNEYGRMYNPSTVETVTGEVVIVDRIAPLRGMSYGIHIILRTDSEEISVHLGPGWFIENQDIKIEAKDKIKVIGSRIIFQGSPAIIAAEVTKEDFKLKLRDVGGFPVWNGWRRRRWH